MKEKITDLFDDIPVELLDEIEVQKGNGHGRKKGIYIPKWAAVLVIGLLCLFAGDVYKRQDQDHLCMLY